MLKKFLFYGDGMAVRRGWIRGLMWGVGLLCYTVLLSPFYAGAETNTCIQSPSGVISWWPGEGNTNDIIAGNNGIITTEFSGTVDYSAGKVGQGFDFHGANFVEIPPIPLNDFTIDLWLNQRTRSTDPYDFGAIIISNEVCAIVDDWHMGLLGNGRLFIRIGDGVAGRDLGYKSTGAIPLNTFTHIALTRSISTGQLKIYINGVLDSTHLLPHNRVLGASNPRCDVNIHQNKIGIGNLRRQAIYVGKTVAFDGIIDEPEIFNMVLSASEIQNIYNAGSAGCRNNPPTASAGPDQGIECAGPSGASVTLNGSASSDPDSDSLTYAWTWNGGSAEGAAPTVTLPLGTTVVTLTVSDGKTTATDTVNITVQDKTPPITTATGGSDNWYNANVISSFSSTDSCSGVKEVHYTVNGTETVVTGDSASLTLTTDGTHNIAYYSIDNAGNAESPNSMTIKIDKTPPALDLSASPNILWSPNHEMVDVLISGRATDASSGIAAVAFTVADEYGIIQPSISDFNTTIQLEASREGSDEDGRLYTISAVASDAAGNKTTAYTTVLVPHDQGN